MPRVDEDYDSDDESIFSGDGQETSVHLGLPDGEIEDEADLKDAAVSRIGGPPALIVPTDPAFSSSCCKICQEPMELLVQMLCPFEDSPYDRTLYIWGCARPSCQTKSTPKGGSVRAWRGLRFNAKYAAKLEAKRAAKEKKAKAEAAAKAAAAAESAKPKANPFSISSSGSANPFGAGFGGATFGSSNAFSASQSPPEEDSPAPEDEPDSSDEEDEDSDTSSLNLALESTTISDSQWRNCPKYPPIYLSTVAEYLPAATDPLKSKNVEVVTDIDESNDKEGGAGWNAETYENSLNVDPVFERFSKRVGAEGEQCVRYDLNGTPLLFSSDPVFDALFPVPKPQAGEAVSVTRGDFKVSSASEKKRTYTPNGPKAQDMVPSCPGCGSRRVFECQLMPNLLNLCKKPDEISKKVQVNEGDKEDASVIRKEMGMEWGTCLIFSCEKDCAVSAEGGKDVKECWREEVVLIQWDT